MPPLQTAVSSLSVPVAVWAGFLLVAAVLGVAASAVIPKLDEPMKQYRRFRGVVLLPLAACAFLALIEVTFGFIVLGGGVESQPGFLVTTAALYLEALGAGAVFLAGYAPTVRAIRAVRDIEYSTTTAVSKMARIIVVASVFFAIIFAGVLVGVSVITVVAVTVAVVLGVYLTSPWYATLLTDTRRPDAEMAERIDRLADRAGLAIRDIRILPNADTETVPVSVRGVSGFKRLFLGELFLDVFDDDTATALLAIQAGATNARMVLRKMGLLTVLLVILLTSLLDALWVLLLTPLPVLAWVWLIPGGVRAADDYAARQVGAAAVADAMVATAEYHDVDPSRHSGLKTLVAGPGLGDRIERLRAKTE